MSVDPLESFLEQESSRADRSCKICTDAELALVVVRFLDVKRDGRTAATLNRFHVDCVQSRMGKALGESTLRRHVRTCLRRNHKTGGDL